VSCTLATLLVSAVQAHLPITTRAKQVWMEQLVQKATGKGIHASCDRMQDDSFQDDRGVVFDEVGSGRRHMESDFGGES